MIIVETPTSIIQICQNGLNVKETTKMRLTNKYIIDNAKKIFKSYTFAGESQFHSSMGNFRTLRCYANDKNMLSVLNLMINEKELPRCTGQLNKCNGSYCGLGLYCLKNNIPLDDNYVELRKRLQKPDNNLIYDFYHAHDEIKEDVSFNIAGRLMKKLMLMPADDFLKIEEALFKQVGTK